eukprot:3260415-Pyramimonas_sp.AAC.1
MWQEWDAAHIARGRPCGSAGPPILTSATSTIGITTTTTAATTTCSAKCTTNGITTSLAVVQ